MTKKIVFALFATVVLMCSCSTSQSALSDLRGLSYRINTEGSYYDVKDWKNCADKYYSINKRIAHYATEGKYTNEEMNEIGELQANCMTGFAQGAGDNLKGKINSAVSLVKGFIKGITNKLLE